MIRMDRNVGSEDQALRTAVGAVAGAASIATLVWIEAIPTVFSPALGLVAVAMLATAAAGTCPLYSALGVDSCSRGSRPS